jgi:predicted CXXCH cytochrome family protein
MPGTPFDDSYNLSLLRPGLYYADGQIRDEVFVYGSFLQSKMYARGVGCMDCHNPHTAQRRAQGNAVCTQCHNLAARPDFPSLKPAIYDSPEHHFHEMGSEGAQCKSCHMVERVYMGNDWRADHSFRIPRPDLSGQTGAPDACTGCHTDRDHEWAAVQIEAWYPQSDNRGRHYGQTLAFGHRDLVAAGDDLAALALDESQPGIARATALWLLQQSNSPEIATRLVPLLTDADPVVRAAAVGVQRTADPQDWALRLIEVLDDPRRNVRIAAAQALVGAPIARLPAPYDAQLQSAMTEWRQSLAGRLDFPETHLQVAGAALTMRRFPAAMQAFGEAVKLDPQRIDAWVMLVRIGAALGHGEVALRETLAKGLAANPNNPALLGLLDELNGEFPMLEGEVPGQAGSPIE